MKKNTGIITFGGKPMTILGEMIKLNDVAQDFTLTANDLSAVKLSDFDGKVKVISVMPSIDTGICASQTRRFNVEASKLSNVVVLTVSVDLPFALKRFCGAEGIENAITLSDYKAHDFGQKYGFVIEELSLLARGVLVVDQNNIVKYVEYVPEIASEPNYDAAIEVVKQLV